MSIPSTHRALALVEKGKAAVQEKPLPPLREDSILIHVKAVALNPIDWKHIERFLNPGDSIGCDFSGDIVAVGSEVDTEKFKFKIGDAVAGFTRGGFNESSNGAFQEYVTSIPESIWLIPRGKLAYDEAAPMGGIALSTAVYGLYGKLRLPPPWAPAKERTTSILIWSGATSVGMYAIRLAKLSNLRIATTASTKHHAFLKELGADIVLDYKDPEAPQKIKEWGNNQLEYVFDTISEHGSTKLAAHAVGDKGGTITTLIPVEKEGEGWPERVEIPPRVFIFTTLSRESGRDFSEMAEWNHHLSTDPSLATQLSILPLKRLEGGLEAIPEGLRYIMAGKVSGEKMVVTL